MEVFGQWKKLISVFKCIPFIWKWHISNIFCKSSPGFQTLLLVFCPIPPYRSSLEQWCFGAVSGQHGLSTPKIFYGVEMWRLARPLQDLEMLLMKPLHYQVVFLGSLSSWKNQPHFTFNVLADGGKFYSKCHNTWPHSFFPSHRSVTLVPLQKSCSMIFKSLCFTVCEIKLYL